MKSKHVFILALLGFSTFRSQLSTGFAQGSLTPSGPPGPTMVTLSQIEPRTPISAPTNITASGSYYLTTNIAGVSGGRGIQILTNNVALDLAGFAVQGVTGSVDGIYIPNAQTNITVRNGNVSGWGDIGLYGVSTSSVNVVVEGLNVSACGTGIFVYSPVVVRDCNCQNNAVDGIYCNSGSVIGCTVEHNGVTGIDAYYSTVSGCIVESNAFDGILLNSSTVTGCQVGGNTHSGIYVGVAESVVIGNTCKGNNTANSPSDAGIYINDSRNRIENNYVTASGYAGIAVNSGFTNNIIIKNSVLGNGANNYLVPGLQIVGPLINTTGTITNSNPWANFSF